jgi:[NiFe] hydrogenase diaphorase moiety large subunit
VDRVLEDCGARDPQAVQMAGPAGHLVPAPEFGRRVAFEDLSTGGSFMVFGQQRDMVDTVLNFAGFFRHESCGFCTPCRIGTSLMEDLLAKVHDGHGSPFDLQEMRHLGEVMRHTSHCGLGQTAANAVLDAMDKFPEAFEGRLKAATFEPAFDLDGALSEARALTGRDDAEAHL